MKENVDFYRFEVAFRIAERRDQFTYDGKKALFDYLEQLEAETGQEIELDVIALCCEYTEYENIEEVKGEYENVKDINDLRNNTTVIEFDTGLIIQDY